MNTPSEVLSAFINIGKTKTALKPVKMFVLAMLAGAFIAFAGIGSTVIGVSVQEASLAKFLGAAVFPAGLAMVVVAGSELFTGNCLIAISVIQKEVKLRGMLYNLSIVYLGNLVGAMFVALCVVYSHIPSLFSRETADAIVSTAAAKTALPFGDAFIRGLLCNILVCIAVWMSVAAKSAGGKIAAVYFPVMLFVLCGFEHSVANMYYIPAGIFTAAEYGIQAQGLDFAAFFINNLIPVTLGNILGGLLVGGAYSFAYAAKKQ